METSNQVDEQPIVVTSTKSLLSLELSDLMELISSESPAHKAEDLSYLTTILQHVTLAKKHQREDDYESSLKFMSKAVKQATSLVALRKETGLTDYAIIEAPLYYQMGSIITTYIETKSDVFGNLPVLENNEDSDEEGEGDDEEAADAANEKPDEEGASQEGGKGNDDEPKIEDVPNLTAKNAQDQEEEKEGQIDGADEGEQQDGQDNAGNNLAEDALENLLACIQISGDFINQGLSGGLAQRRKVVSNLLIDAQIRLGDITLFKEDVMGAVESYRKVVDLCREFIEGNERVLPSTLFQIGVCLQDINKLSEAGQAFQESIDAMRSALFLKLAENNQPVSDTSVPTLDLVKPSIFDTDQIKEIRAMIKDMLDKQQETKEQERMNVEIEELKKKQGEDVKVDANFGKVQENAAEFKDMSSMIKIGKKRAQPEPLGNGLAGEMMKSSVEPEVTKKPKNDQE